MEIKIVGILSDKDEIHEIERIAKVFIVEERMKDLICHVETNEVIGNIYLGHAKKINLCSELVHGYVPFLTVKGLNWSRTKASKDRNATSF